MTPLDTALQWLDLGIATIPIHYYGKNPKFNSFIETGDISNSGKPEWNPYKEKLPDKDRIKIWFKSKFTNIAILTGWRNLVIIDFDNQSIWELWKSWIQFEMPELLHNTYRVKTRRGEHIYLFVENYPESGMKIQTNEENPIDRSTLIDIKACGGYCLIPPSIHPSGSKYICNGHRPSDIITVENLSDVLPSLLLERAADSNYYETPLPKPKPQSIWEITPIIDLDDPVGWIRQNRNIIEFFPEAKRGNNGFYSVHCPFHQDKKHSGWIKPETNRFGCRKGCTDTRGIGFIDFYCHLKQIDFKQALRELAG